MKGQSCHLSPLQTPQFQVLGVPHSSRNSTRKLNVGQGIAPVNNKLKVLQLQSALQIQNARFRHAFLWSNMRPTFFKRASQHPNARSVFLLQNTRPASMQKQNARLRPAFLWNNMRPMFFKCTSQHPSVRSAFCPKTWDSHKIYAKTWFPRSYYSTWSSRSAADSAKMRG